MLSHIWFIDQGQLALSARMADLAGLLRTGVANSAADLPAQEGLLYQERIGQQIAYVALRSGGDAPTAVEHTVQLELLYKALSLNRDSMLAALAPWQQDAVAQEPA